MGRNQGMADQGNPGHHHNALGKRGEFRRIGTVHGSDPTTNPQTLCIDFGHYHGGNHCLDRRSSRWSLLIMTFPASFAFPSTPISVMEFRITTLKVPLPKNAVGVIL